MSDQTFDPRLESMLRHALAAEVASLPLTVGSAEVLERAARRPNARLGARLRRLLLGPPNTGLRLLSVAVATVAVLTGAAVVVSNLPRRVDFPAAALPTSAADWSRVVINAGAQGDVDSVAAGPRGLLAAVGEGEESRLYFSADGQTWTRVPADQVPPNGANGAALVATDQGFLLIGTDVLASDDGLTWRRIADPISDSDLAAGTPIAATAGGPGYVAVGADNKAWYSIDGTDWTMAEVPPPLGEPSRLARPLDRTSEQGVVEMLGVAVSGRDLVAWGTSNWVHDDQTSTFLPVLWASSDGLTWTSVPAPQPTRYATVAGGPNGFLLLDTEYGAVWLSADGRSWEHVAGDTLGSSRWPAQQNDDGHRVEMIMGSTAAGPAGYIAVGTDGSCLLSCSSAETVIWTSADGRQWSRLPNDELFRAPTGAGAHAVAAWGSDFIVGGHHGGHPAIWISVSDLAGAGSDGRPVPAGETPTAETTPDLPAAFAGTWQATDPPPDSSHLTMEIVGLAEGTYEVTILDDYASVCAGASSTMTGVAPTDGPYGIVIEQPEFTCDDGSEAQALSGPPLREQLQNLRFTYDLASDELSDSLGGLVWTRVEATP
jgi:hypothetical protein